MHFSLSGFPAGSQRSIITHSCSVLYSLGNAAHPHPTVNSAHSGTNLGCGKQGLVASVNLGSIQAINSKERTPWDLVVFALQV